MKIKIFLILYLSANPFLFAKERMTHTFKTHNFRIELPTHWELKKSLDNHKKKPILTASSKEDRINLEIYVFPWKGGNLRTRFVETLRNLQLRAENFANLETEVEFPLYNLEGYWAKTTGYRQKKKIYGYIVYANDGVNLFVIHAYTNSILFSKNFLTMKDIFKGFSLNRNYKNDCCNECSSQFPKGSKLEGNCSNFAETGDCMIYFQNKPHTISQCR